MPWLGVSSSEYYHMVWYGKTRTVWLSDSCCWCTQIACCRKSINTLSTRPQSLGQAPQCPWFVLKYFRAHRCFLSRPNPGGQIVGSWTKSQFTTEAKLQSSCHLKWCPLAPCHTRGMRNVSQCWDGWSRPLLRGHAWYTVALATSPSTALHLKAGGSICQETMPRWKKFDNMFTHFNTIRKNDAQ